MKLEAGKSYIDNSGTVVRIYEARWSTEDHSGPRYRGDNGCLYREDGVPEGFYGDHDGGLGFASTLVKEYVEGEPAQPTAPDLLMKAADLLAERSKEYDTEEGERSMGKAVASFNAITGRDLTEAEGWLLLQQLKDVRQWQNDGYHADSAEDCISYAALKAEALREMVQAKRH